MENEKTAQSDDYATGRLEGEEIAKGQFIYFLLGLLWGIIGVIIAIAYLPKPKKSFLVGKSASYILGFTEGFQKQSKSKNIIYSIIGCVIWFAVLIPILQRMSFS